MSLSVPLHPASEAAPRHPAVLTARNLPLITSVGRSHLGRSSSKAASVALRRFPHPVRRMVGTEPLRTMRPELAALALAADGHPGDARAVLERAVRTLPVATGGAGRELASRLRLAHAAVVLHDLPLARQALGEPVDHTMVQNATPGAPSPHTEAALSVTRSLVAAEQGNLDEALDHLHGIEGAAARNLHNRLSGERQVLRTQLMTTSLVEPAAPRPIRSPPRVSSVLHLVSGALPDQQTGYTIRTQGVVSGQRSAGLDARVVTRLGFPVDVGVLGAATEADVEGVPYHRLLPRRGLPTPGIVRQEMAVAEVESLVRRVKPDVLHAHSKHENAQVAVVAGRRLGVPVVYEARGFLEETWVSTGGSRHTDFYRWTREAETRCMQQVHQVITLSAAMKQDIVARGIAADRVHVVPNAVPRAFAERPLGSGGEQRQRARERVRRQYGIPLGSTVFGSVSTLNGYEGLDCAIEALALMDDPTQHLMIVGDGPARGMLEDRALEVGVGSRVHLTSRVPHRVVRDYLDAMDVFVVPRRMTPVTRLVPPLKPVEAMAVGLPLLVSDLAPLIEIAQPGRFGRVAAPDHPAGWAREMAALADAPTLRDELGAAAAAFVREERTWETLARQYARIYAATLTAE